MSVLFPFLRFPSLPFPSPSVLSFCFGFLLFFPFFVFLLGFCGVGGRGGDVPDRAIN
jgi:hypothetical protein